MKRRPDHPRPPQERLPAGGYAAERVSTGIPALDPVLDHLRIGDNVVWQVGDVEDYARFVRPFVAAALAAGRRVVYLRFARHRPLLEASDGVHVEAVDAQAGFEQFSQQVRRIADREGRRVFYVFDMLSDLLQAWATDLMVGNFFRITCPRLFVLDTVAYFGLLRNSHSYQTVARIRETTQVLLEVYNAAGTLCVHPVKVWNRRSPTMFLPHIVRDDAVEPVFRSAEASALFSAASLVGFPATNRGLDSWERRFVRAAEVYERARSGDAAAVSEERALVEPLCRLLLGRDERMLALAREYFTLADLLAIKSRLIGSGRIGGKAVGMLLARKMLEREFRDDRGAPLELHDSFYVGSDVFYTYLVDNDLWQLRMEQRDPERYFTLAGELQRRLREGVLPEDLREPLLLMLEYFGQSPIIVRSSSLLEDSFGNAFAGKYESVYCVNQGSLEQRFAAFERAMKQVYASTMNPDALTYRLQRGLHDQDEQMALLVQRVSGDYRGAYFFPDAAGVGVSYSTYVWTPAMDPRAGMLRMVFGLGTRAVGRAEDDYARLVFLDDPAAQPFAPEDAPVYAQRRADVLSIERNRLETVPVDEALCGITEGFAAAVVSRTAWVDREGVRREGWVVDFDRLLAKTDFVPCMRRMLNALERGYRYPVEIEFTVNLDSRGAYKVNLLQCRPLQTKGLRAGTAPTVHVPRDRQILRVSGGFMGGNVHQRIMRAVVVDAAAYAAAPLSRKYQAARTIGKINRLSPRDACPTLLIAPGRLGTTTPSLGVPVSFAEISCFAALCEVADPAHGFAPELSFGSHFFQDLVEMDMFYLALFPDKPGTVFDRAALCPVGGNALRKLLPDAAPVEPLVYVREFGPDTPVSLVSSIAEQTACLVFTDERTDQSATMNDEVLTHGATR